ncbi:HNH endonuclease [Klebsiella aerogenes]|nr:hypothetical protein [Klebsiella aerogenes]
MKKLTTPIKVNSISINITSTLDAIFSSCTRDGVRELRAFRDDWLLELNNYLIEMGSSKRLITNNHKSFEKHKNILIWLYENPLASRKTLYIKELRDAYIEEGITCPYCGIGTATTLDHYYCKSTLPQFSILKENLIPCCGECNKTKGTLKPKKKWKRVFNPYFDDFSGKINAPPIVIHFKEKGDGVLFHITPNPMLSRIDKMHINFHISKLGIKKKHKEKIITHFKIESNALKTQKELVASGDLTSNGFSRLIQRRLDLGETIGYDWSIIILYSLFHFKDNHWCYV